MRILKSVKLQANSPRQAQYQIELGELALADEGTAFVVITQSGADGSKMLRKTSYFPILEMAEKEFTSILWRKTRGKKGGRQYDPALPDKKQYDLF